MFMSGRVADICCVWSFQQHSTQFKPAVISRSWSILGPFVSSSLPSILGDVSSLKRQEFSQEIGEDRVWYEAEQLLPIRLAVLVAY